MTFAFVNNCRREMAQLAVPESVATLDLIEDFFHNGLNWTRDTYKAENGARCLVGAANYVRVSQIDCAKHWLLQAIKERAPQLKTIEAYNDSRRSYEEVAGVIRRAKQLAQQAQLPAPRPVAALPAPVTGKNLPAVRASSASVPAVRDVTPPAPQRVGRYRPGLTAGVAVAAGFSAAVFAALLEE